MFYRLLFLIVLVLVVLEDVIASKNFSPELKYGPKLDLTKAPLRSAYPIWTPKPIENPSKLSPALIITPYLQQTDGIKIAQTLSEVKGGPFPSDIISYSGFFQVNEQKNSSLFFWFFRAEENPDTAPVVVWLQGGPGSSSLFGLFQELGPFMVNTDDNTLIKNPYSWHKKFNLIFIDNPVGTGFSYTNDGYATDMPQVADELYNALIQFFTLFPELQKNKFYISGESYAGKYVPSIAYKIDQENPNAELKINLQGIAVGNGFTDPYSILNYSELVYQMGMIDINIKNEMNDSETIGKTAIDNENYYSAFQQWSDTLNLFQYAAQFYNIYNILYAPESTYADNYVDFIQSEEVRELIHVGSLEFSSDWVYEAMVDRFMTSSKPTLEHLLEKYSVLYYNGQMDIICAYALSERMFQNLNWSAKNEYDVAQRKPWYIGKDLAGYIKKAGLFKEVLIRNAGHMVPTDQPLWAYELINSFVNNTLN